MLIGRIDIEIGRRMGRLPNDKVLVCSEHICFRRQLIGRGNGHHFHFLSAEVHSERTAKVTAKHKDATSAVVEALRRIKQMRRSKGGINKELLHSQLAAHRRERVVIHKTAQTTVSHQTANGRFAHKNGSDPVLLRFQQIAAFKHFAATDRAQRLF